MAEVIRLYDSGLTKAEVAASLGTTPKVVHNRLRDAGHKCRVAAKRDQRGDKNDSWRGEDATYSALHFRVEVARGKPNRCERCGVAGLRRYEWANQTGDYTNVADYMRLCLPCHRTQDAARRRSSGRSTTAHVPRKRKEVVRG